MGGKNGLFEKKLKKIKIFLDRLYMGCVIRGLLKREIVLVLIVLLTNVNIRSRWQS